MAKILIYRALSRMCARRRKERSHWSAVAQSVVECLSQDRGVADSSLTSVTVRCVLEQDTLILA